MNLSDLVTIEYAPLPGSMGAQWADVLQSLGDGSRDLYGLPSGLAALDAAISGIHGFTVVRGVPGSGKSSFLAWLTLRATAEGVNCWFLSAEMGAGGGWVELLRTHYKCDRDAIDLRGRLILDAQPPDVFGRIVVTDAEGYTPETFAEACKPFGFVVVDSLQALPYCNGGEYDSLNAWLKAISKAAAKGLPGADGRAVWLISQSTKEADKELESLDVTDPDISSKLQHGGRGSAGITYTADTELVLRRDSAEGERWPISVFIPKKRRGQAGKNGFKLEFQPMTGQWAEAPTSYSVPVIKPANNGKAQYQRKK